MKLGVNGIGRQLTEDSGFYSKIYILAKARVLAPFQGVQPQTWLQISVTPAAVGLSDSTGKFGDVIIDEEILEIR